MNDHLRTLQALGPTIAYNPRLNAMTGSPLATIFLCQLYYWTYRTSDPDGWVYKTREDWEEEIGFSRRNQETARKKLRDEGILEEELRGVPAKLYYRINEVRFNELFDQLAGTKAPSQLVRKRPTGRAESAQLYTEITTEITTIPPTPHSGADMEPLFPENEQANHKPETNQQIILDSWNQLAKHHNVTPVSKLTPARKSSLNARLKDPDWRAGWREAMKQIPDCPHLVGDNERGWRASFEWFTRPDSVTKILEGNYTRAKGQQHQETDPSVEEALRAARRQR